MGRSAPHRCSSLAGRLFGFDGQMSRCPQCGTVGTKLQNSWGGFGWLQLGGCPGSSRTKRELLLTWSAAAVLVCARCVCAGSAWRLARRRGQRLLDAQRVPIAAFPPVPPHPQGSRPAAGGAKSRLQPRLLLRPPASPGRCFGLSRDPPGRGGERGCCCLGSRRWLPRNRQPLPAAGAALPLTRPCSLQKEDKCSLRLLLMCPLIGNQIDKKVLTA